MEELDALGGELSPRNISMEDAFSRQNDRILYLRSLGQPYTEAVLALMDMLAGLEDDQFYDGIPDKVRQTLSDLQPEAEKEVREKYRPRGWSGMRIRGIPGANGRVIYRPTSDDLAEIYRLTLSLAQRRGLIWRTKRKSRLTQEETPSEAVA